MLSETAYTILWQLEELISILPPPKVSNDGVERAGNNPIHQYVSPRER